MSSISVTEALSQSGSSPANAAALLWHLDTNRLDPLKSYQLDLQVNARGKSFTPASRRLFKFWSGAIWQRPTFKAFRNLLDYYDQRSISSNTLDEELEFIRLVCGTNCIQFVHKWLVREQYISPCDIDGFSELLVDMWFTGQSVNARKATGFEHVFCGEIQRSRRRERLSGLRNYVRVFMEEEFGNFKYIGYVDKGGEMESKEAMITIRFELHGHEKCVSSMFFGVSPEFEFALYTLLGMAGVGNVVVQYGRCRVNVSVKTRDKKILMAYPCLLEVGKREGEASMKRRRLEFGVIDLTGDGVAMDEVRVVDLTGDNVGVMDLTEEDEVGERKNRTEENGENGNVADASKVGTKGADVVGEVGNRTQANGPREDEAQTSGPVKGETTGMCRDKVEASEPELNGVVADGRAEKVVERSSQGNIGVQNRDKVEASEPEPNALAEDGHAKRVAEAHGEGNSGVQKNGREDVDGVIEKTLDEAVT